MFNLLKDKLKSWLGKKVTEKPIKEKKAKSSKKTKEKAKVKKTEKQSKKEIVKIKDKSSKKETPKIEEEMPQEPVFESVEEEKPVESKEEKPSFFSKIFGKISSAKITQEQVDNIFEELQLILLENNVALEVVDEVKQELNKELVGFEVKKEEIANKIKKALRLAIERILQEPEDLISEIKNSKGLYTIIFFGINGSGKTTSIAKLAHKLKKQGISVALAAADTFRAAAVEQLEIHAKRIGVPIIKSQYGSDPTAVAFDAKIYSEKNNIKCLLIDTAGRMYTKENLIKQMEKIVRVIKPNKRIFVGESTTGNDMIDQIKTFNEAIGIDGIILSKADVDERGGTALSVSYVTKKPIYFIGTGQNYEDLKEFNKIEIIKNLGL